MRAIIWHLVYWGIIILPRFGQGYERIEFGFLTAMVVLLIWGIPFILFLNKDLEKK